LRDRLVPWIGRRREPAPAEPAPAAAPTEAAPPPAEPAAPRPRIVLLGTEPRAIGLIEIYGLDGRDDVALSDRRPGRDGGEVWGRRVWSFDALALDEVEAVVVTEDPIGDYADALRFLEAKGVPPERIATCGAARPGAPGAVARRGAPAGAQPADRLLGGAAQPLAPRPLRLLHGAGGGNGAPDVAQPGHRASSSACGTAPA
jgi:hypothetical protein